jgi:hypothetical protein
LARRHVDARLQTALSPEGLQARLLNLFRDAQTMIEEQGVNIGFGPFSTATRNSCTSDGFPADSRHSL